MSYLLAGIGQPVVLTQTRIIQTAFFIVAVISFSYLWGVKGVAVAANFMMLIGTIILVVKIRRFVSFSLSRMLRWPLVALILASIAGLITLYYGENLTIWSSLFLKSSVVSIVYLLTLYLTERKVFHEYAILILQPLWEKMKSLIY